METQNNQNNPYGLNQGKMRKVVIVTLVLLAIFLLTKAIGEVRGYAYIGRDVATQTTINVNGKGEVLAVPDVATVTFGVTEEATTVASAQQKATDRANKAVDFLKTSDIDEKDIKTTYYNISPKYTYSKSSDLYPYGREVLVGYTVSQGFEVKIRKIDEAGQILSGIGGLGVQNVSGLNFSVDNEDELKIEARAKAIADAKTQADKLAKALGVRLVRIIYFSEGGNYPIYYGKAEVMGMGGDSASSVPAPAIPTGENKITSNVSITYEIR